MTDAGSPRIGLIAGQGALPEAIHAALTPQVAGVWHLDGFAPERLSSKSFRIEQLGSFIATLKKEGITQLCFAGKIERPELNIRKVDLKTLPLVPRMMQALGQGDDGALRLVLGFFEEAGIEIKGAHELCPALLPPSGLLIGKPDKAYRKSLDRAIGVHNVMAQGDVGQGLVVRASAVLAIETSLGTDWMLASVSGGEAMGGLFYKAPKAGQDRRIDLPVVGPATVQAAARAGLSGIAIEAGGVMLLEPARSLACAVAAGIFIDVVDRAGDGA